MATNDISTLQRLQLARTPKAKSAPKAPQKANKPPKKAYDKDDLETWFIEGDRIATGKCAHCGGRTCKGDPLYFKHSQAHILPKRLFPSVATHPKNRIELCFWENNCHGNLDEGRLDLMDLNCFDEVIEKFIAMYSDIAPEERRHIPDILRQYIDSNT